MTARPKVLIAEDHVIFAELLAKDLCKDNDILGVAHTSSEVLVLAECLLPNLLLLDLALGRESGFDLLPRLKQVAPGCKVVVLTNFNHTGFQARARDLGVQGFVSKTESLACLTAVISTVLSGGTRYAIADDDLGYVPCSPISSVHLSPRQVDVLHQFSRGLSYREIGLATGLSENTVDMYLRRIRRALGAHKPVDLVRLARQHGFLPRELERTLV